MRLNETRPLTLEEHRELGNELRRVRARMSELRDLAADVYGASSRATFSFSRTCEALDRLRADMDAQLAQDTGYPSDGIYW